MTNNDKKKINKQEEQTETSIVEATTITNEQNREALKAAALKTLTGAVPVVKDLVAIVEKINTEVKEQKLNNLLLSYRDRFESLELAQEQFAFLMSSGEGVMLFHKIIQMVDNGTTDEDWIELMASVLKNISNSDIVEQFEEKRYLLSQIARLSPQALIVLNKGQYWGSAKFTGATTTSKQTMVGDWDVQVSEFFMRSAGIKEESVKIRIAHAFRELESTGMVYLTEDKSLGCTQIGARIQNYTN